MKPTTKYMLAGVGVVVLIASAAVASSYITRSSLEPKFKQQEARVYHTQPLSMAASQPAQRALPPCDDKNIVGTIGGGVAGGVVGNQFGGGSGKTLATVGGAIGGAYLGNQYLPTRNATCR